MVDREAFGLSAQKPSEMVAGLDEVAKRAEKLEEREAAKRRAGGKMSANVGLHIDEVGARWKRRVNIGIVVAVVLVLASLGLMLFLTVHKRLDPREGNAEAHKMLSALAGYAQRPDFFKEGETITAEEARKRLQADAEAEYQRALAVTTPNPKNRYRTPDVAAVKDREFFEKLRLLQDAWGQPFVFEIAGDNLKISAIGKRTAASEGPEPVMIPLRRGPAEAPPKSKQ